MNPEFLDLEDALEMHAMQLALFGGLEGLRDLGLLESALAQPAAVFNNEFLHTDLFEMAAAYLFHIVSNHPFLDGNKRTALISALVFLNLNGLVIDHDHPALEKMVLKAAQGKIGKPQIAAFLKKFHKHSKK